MFFMYDECMEESFLEMLAIGGKSNSLGRTSEVIEAVIKDRSRIEELYACTLNKDPWVRMRAIDAIEKISRQHPDWILPFVERFSADLHGSTQPSIQWHLAQIYRQIDLEDTQVTVIRNWLQRLVSTSNVDWIVAANTMDTLNKFNTLGYVSTNDFRPLLLIQTQHKSNAVKKRADKYLNELSP